ncbi:urease accessory protein UreF [Roseibium sp. CAU 1639]|uniref:Urease accessory protein UreF n=2 Tax=Roseibium sediminicola TaxID=2933272 RepID=A0ABT0GYF5_9HYPH|nr:urease accessory protein UreF [Roseibium sp. CAU 1639]MCK7614465.1 urease accessory protein UreF [Roseibium sp. CAU 1639]
MTEPVSLSALYRLMTFLSPGFPVGAFTYSHGLEQVVESGAVADASGLEAWLSDILRFGAGRSDAILLKETIRVARDGDASAVADLRELGLALQPSRERHLETSAQGTAFVTAIRNSWLPETGTPAGQLFHDHTADDDPWPYPVAVGLACAAHAIPSEAALAAYLQAFAANLVSAAIRTVPLGQSEGQSVLAALEPIIFEVAKEAAAADLADLGSSTFLADIASMAHETQYSRLFRS